MFQELSHAGSTFKQALLISRHRREFRLSNAPRRMLLDAIAPIAVRGAAARRIGHELNVFFSKVRGHAVRIDGGSGKVPLAVRERASSRKPSEAALEGDDKVYSARRLRVRAGTVVAPGPRFA